MIEEGKLGAAATVTAVTVLAAMWLFKDLIMATMKPAKPFAMWGRFRFLRLIGREGYVGRHRLA